MGSTLVNRAWGDSIGDGWRMKDTDSSSGAMNPTLFWGRLVYIHFSSGFDDKLMINKIKEVSKA